MANFLCEPLWHLRWLLVQNSQDNTSHSVFLGYIPLNPTCIIDFLSVLYAYMCKRMIENNKLIWYCIVVKTQLLWFYKSCFSLLPYFVRLSEKKFLVEQEGSLDDFLGFIRSTAVFQRLELDQGTQQANLSIASLRDRCSKPSQYDIVMSALYSVSQ